MRLWRWLIRRDARTETQRAVVLVLLTWLGGTLGVFVIIWSVLTQQWAGVMQGGAISLLAFTLIMGGPSSR